MTILPPTERGKAKVANCFAPASLITISLPEGWGPLEPETPKELDGDGLPKLDLSHDGLALEMGRLAFDVNARFISSAATWFLWSGLDHWRRDEKGLAIAMSRQFLRQKAAGMAKWADRKSDELATSGKPGEGARLKTWAKIQNVVLRDRKTISAVEGLARTNASSAAAPDDFDGDPDLLGCPGLTINLQSGEVRGAQREDMISRRASIVPVDGMPWLFLEFLATIFNDDREKIAMIRRFIGYSLTGHTREHKLLFLYGTGANGKSTLLNLLFDLLADYARRAPSSTFLNKQTDSHPTDLAGLRGARLVIASELRKGATWDDATIKDLTGGDVITARYMRGDFFDLRPVAKLWIAGNSRPSFKGVDEAMRRRMVMVPFEVTIPAADRDPTLPDRLKAEAGRSCPGRSRARWSGTGAG